MEDTEKETEELDMSKKTKEEIAVFGLGVALNHLKDIAKTQKDILTVVRYLENKVEALMD